MPMRASHSVAAETAVTLTGTVWRSAGSFCAVTVTVGRVSRGVAGAGVCAEASAGASEREASTIDPSR